MEQGMWVGGAGRRGAQPRLFPGACATQPPQGIAEECCRVRRHAGARAFRRKDAEIDQEIAVGRIVACSAVICYARGCAGQGRGHAHPWPKRCETHGSRAAAHSCVGVWLCARTRMCACVCKGVKCMCVRACLCVHYEYE